MYTRIKHILNEFNHFGLTHLGHLNPIDENKSGGNNNIYFGHLPALQVSQNALVSRGLPLALSIDRDYAAYTFFKGKNNTVMTEHFKKFIAEKKERIRKLQRLIHKKELYSPFIQTLLYYDDNGNIISQKMTNDLHHYLQGSGKKISLSQFKEMLGQIILAVHVLHEKQMVHRDIKPENFFVLDENGKLYIELADIEYIIEVDKQGRPTEFVRPQASDNCSSPEVLITYPDNNHQYPAQYNQLDLKSADCFSLGATIEYFIFQCNLGTRIGISNELKRIMALLLDQNPKKRPSVKEMMENSFFGNTPEKRNDFFEKIKQKYQRDLHIDSYYFKHAFSEGDFFYFFPSEIKEIYHFAESVIIQIQHWESFRVADISAANTAIQMLQSIQKNILALLIHIRKSLAQNSLSAFHPLLNLLREELVNTVQQAINLIELSIDDISQYLKKDSQPNRMPLLQTLIAIVGNALRSNDLKSFHERLESIKLKLSDITLAFSARLLEEKKVSSLLNRGLFSKSLMQSRIDEFNELEFDNEKKQDCNHRFSQCIS